MGDMETNTHLIFKIKLGNYPMKALNKLVNTAEKIEITLTEEKIANPVLISKELEELGFESRIGVIQLRSLIAGKVDEVCGFVLIEGEVKQENTDSELEKMLTDGAKTTEALLKEVKVEEGTSIEEELLAAAGNDQIIDSAIKTEVDAAFKEELVPSKETEKLDTTAAKKALGITGDVNLTPSSSTTSTRKPRKDVPALIAKAEKGANKQLLASLVGAGFTIVDVEKSERWFSVTPKGVEPKMGSTRFDISPRKSGDFGVSLYLNNKASGIKTVVKSDPTQADGIKAVIAWATSDAEVVKATA